MMRFLTLAALLPLMASALHVQVGVTMQALETGTWTSGTTEIGSTIGRVDTTGVTGVTALYVGVGGAKLVFTRNTDGVVGVKEGSDSFNQRVKYFTPAETVQIDGGIGYGNTYNTPYYRNATHDNVVVTMRGDPYSVIVNDTGADRTINGVLVPKGESVRLPFPLYLVMEQLPNAKFYDPNSGDEIIPFHTGVVGESPVYYWGGAYCLNWSGDIRITCDRPTNTSVSNDVPIYADIKHEHEGAILFGRAGSPLYGPYSATTNFTLMTWWDFNQSEWGGSPRAYIGDQCVCSGHSTSHIIDYEVDPSSSQVSFEHPGSFTFTMSQTPQSGYSGGTCVMRCWGRMYGSDTSGYEKAPAAHRAEVSAGTGVATFKVTINGDYTWKVEPVN